MRRWDRDRDMEMAMEEVEALLEKIWDLHDKLSDAILSISRTHFLKSLSANKKPSGDHNTNNHSPPAAKDNSRTPGFVFVKDFAVYDEAIHEAKSLNSIRSALENLEDQLEFLHTVQIQQRAERDTAIARLEQSRIVLAMRLAEHQGKKYKVIEEALAFLGDVRETSRIFLPENLHNTAGENSGNQNKSILIRALVSSLNFARNSLRLDHADGLLGNAALVAITLMAMLNVNQVSENGHLRKHRIDNCGGKRSSTGTYDNEEISPRGSSGQLDVLLGRG